MIGHMVLWRYWMESRQRGDWSREIESLKAMEPAMATFRHSGGAAMRRASAPQAPAGGVKRRSDEAGDDRPVDGR